MSCRRSWSNHVRDGSRAILVVFLAGGLGCATAGGAAGGSSPAPQVTPTAAEPPLAWMLSDEVLVLPLQAIELRATASPDMAPVRPDTALWRRMFDSTFEAAVSRAVQGGHWVWPPALVSLRRRNPTVMPDPARLSVRGLRPGAAVGTQLSQDLGSEIRTLLSLSGARRYVLLPFRLVVNRDAASGQYGYEVHLVAIDSRRAIVNRSFSNTRDRVGNIDQAVAVAVSAAAAAFVVPDQ